MKNWLYSHRLVFGHKLDVAEATLQKQTAEYHKKLRANTSLVEAVVDELYFVSSTAVCGSEPTSFHVETTFSTELMMDFVDGGKKMVAESVANIVYRRLIHG